MRKIKFFIFLLPLLVLCTMTAKAGNILHVQKLGKSSIANGATLKVKDNTIPVELPGSYDKSYKTRVSLVYKRDSLSDLATHTDWSYRVTYSIQFLDNDFLPVGSAITGNVISIKFNTSNPVYESMQVFDQAAHNYGNVLVTVTNVYSTGTLPDDIGFEVALEENSTYYMATSVAFDGSISNGKLAYWSYCHGAESYELEWVFVDDKSTPNNPSTAEAFADNEPVQISTTNQYYELNLTMPKGKVYVRVRGVGSYTHSSGYKTHKYTSWKDLGTITVGTSFESNKNWQYVTTYAEEGKYKKVMTYYDGTLRSRQVLTNISSDSTVLAGETKYDYEGRAVVNILPVPMKDSTLKYQSNFNTFTDGTTTPEKNKYDNLFSNSTTGNDPLTTSSAARKYYSSLNTVENTNRDYVPDAGGYPFAVTQYMSDGTGRVKRQNTVGAAFTLKDADVPTPRYTQYLYGNPNATELHRLFGSNVGDISHYKKNAVIDPNGQISISYHDQQDRVIATALAGANPSNLIKLDSNKPDTLTVSLDGNNKIDYDNYVSRSVNKVMNTVPGTQYRLIYDLTGGNYHEGDVEFFDACKTCTYDLTVKVLNKKDSAIVSITKSNVGSASGCSAGTFSKPALIDSTITFGNVGVYTIIKELSLNQEHLDSLVAALESGPDFPNLDTLIAHEQLGAKIDQCKIFCEDCNGEVDVDTAMQNNCKSLLKQMKMQLSPGGKYYEDLDEMEDALDISDNEAWKNSEDVTISIPSVATLMNAESFTQHNNDYKDEWIKNLVRGHKEYCHYEFCLAEEESDKYDLKMATMKDWEQAKTKEYLNPLGGSSAKEDPFFVDHSGLLSDMENEVDSFAIKNLLDPADFGDVTDDYNSTGSGLDGDLWDFASSYRLYDVSSNDSVTDKEKWLTFRSLYHGLKVERQILVRNQNSCPYLEDEDAVVKKPYMEKDISTAQGMINSVFSDCSNQCEKNVRLWMSMIEQQCPDLADSTIFNDDDSLAVAESLMLYCTFSCGRENPWGLLLIDDVNDTAVHELDSARFYLDTLNCSLSSIATNNPYITTCFNSDPMVLTSCAIQTVRALNDYFQEIDAGSLQTSKPTPWDPEVVLEKSAGASGNNYVGFYRANSDCNQQASCSTSYVYFNHRRKPPCSPPPPGAHATSCFDTTHTRVQFIWGYDNSDYTDYNAFAPASQYKLPGSGCDTSINYSVSFRIQGTSTYVAAQDMFKVYNPRIDFTYSYLGYTWNNTDAYGILVDIIYYDSPTDLDTATAYLMPYDPTEPDLEDRYLKWKETVDNSCMVTGIISCPDDFMTSSVGACPDSTKNEVITPCTHQVIDGINKLVMARNTTNWDFTSAPTVKEWDPYETVDVSGKGQLILPLTSACNAYGSEDYLLLTDEPYDGTSDETTYGFELFGGTTITACTSRSFVAPHKKYLTTQSVTSQKIMFYWMNPSKTYIAKDKIVAIGAPFIDCEYLNGAGNTYDEKASYGIAMYMDVTDFGAEHIDTTIKVYMEASGFDVDDDLVVWKDTVPPLNLTCEPVYVFNETKWKSDCVKQQLEIAKAKAVQKWEIEVEEYKSAFLNDYVRKCLDSTREHLQYDYITTEYHYTLYYYDQAGNLVETVPPAGVNPLDSTAFTKGVYEGTPEPEHHLVTRYGYNSLEQLIYQSTPDGGESFFFYDRKGQLRLSQNAYQDKRSEVDSSANNFYSYTKYDEQGRIKEVGEFNGSDKTHYELTLKANRKDMLTMLDNSAFPQHTGNDTLTQITETFYDEGITGQDNLRGRVAKVTVKQEYADDPEVTTTYSYDPHGNVKQLVQDIKAFKKKKIDYEYDLISGKVNQVIYQKDSIDCFYHQYEYDADNRIRSVQTSQDGHIWHEDAKYFYYKHGPLARTELGEMKVQGMDYAYTLQGWLKGVNIPNPRRSAYSKHRVSHDQGSDGIALSNDSAFQGSTNKYVTSNLHKYVAQDEFAYALNYYNGDYSNIGSKTQGIGSGTGLWSNADMTDGILQSGLYNGNIVSMTTQVHSLADLTAQGSDDFGIRGNMYRYDQLNRLKEARSNTVSSGAWASRSNTLNAVAFDALYGYDANGNIDTASVNTSSSSQMDKLKYQYSKTGNFLNHNRLQYVDDAVSAVTYTDDIDDQSSGNYVYDEIGNLTKDVSEAIKKISWTVYGKVSKVERADTTTRPDLEFVYDGMGNRVIKIVKTKASAGVLNASSAWTYTYYARDASGNVMCSYDVVNNAVTEKEYNLYGSSRVGTYRRSSDPSIFTAPFDTAEACYYRPVTHEYELSNHLGNVYLVVTGLKLGVDTTSDGRSDYYTTAPVAANDYYAFGMNISSRSSSSDSYRYGFNGKENDREVVGDNGWQDYGMRMYNMKLGRFFSVDPITAKFPMLTPYQFASNTPIAAIDLDGLEAVIMVHSKWYMNKIQKALKAGDIKEAIRLAYKATMDPSKDDWGKDLFEKRGAERTSGSVAYSATLSFNKTDELTILGVTENNKRPAILLTIKTSEAKKLQQTIVQQIIDMAIEFEKKSGTEADGGAHGVDVPVEDPNGMGKFNSYDPLEGWVDPDTYHVDKDKDSVASWDNRKEKWFIGPQLNNGNPAQQGRRPVRDKKDSTQYDIK